VTLASYNKITLHTLETSLTAATLFFKISEIFFVVSKQRMTQVCGGRMAGKTDIKRSMTS